MTNWMTWCVVISGFAGAGGEEAKRPPKEIAVELGGGVKMEFVLIPAGSFNMGEEMGFPYEKPVHKVTISRPFYLGKYEVTQEDWETVMGDNPSYFKGKRKPVEQVSWEDCQVFLKTLNAKVSVPTYNFALPTEAQWEYACRAGTRTWFCFGSNYNQLREYAWYDDRMLGGTRPVGQKKPNNWGLYDMHGNVFEWCQDRYASDFYVNSPADDPSGPEAGATRVRRGGAWDRDAMDCRSSYRGVNSADHRDFFLGFRVAQVLTDK